jgi:hypothetical protein
MFGSFLRAFWLVLPPAEFTRAWEPTLSCNQLHSLTLGEGFESTNQGSSTFAIPNSNAGAAYARATWRIDFTDAVATSWPPLARTDKDLAGHVHSLGSDSAQRPFPTEGKGGSCCNLAADVMSAFCRRLGNSAQEICLSRPNFADEGLVFSNT